MLVSTPSTATESLLSSQEVADKLGLSVRTLDCWSYENRGPRFHKIGRHRRYRLSDLERWIDAQAVDFGAA